MNTWFSHHITSFLYFIWFYVYCSIYLSIVCYIPTLTYPIGCVAQNARKRHPNAQTLLFKELQSYASRHNGVPDPNTVPPLSSSLYTNSQVRKSTSYFDDSSSKFISPGEVECPTPLGDSETEPVVPEPAALHDDNLGAIRFGQTSIFNSLFLGQLTIYQEA